MKNIYSYIFDFNCKFEIVLGGASYTREILYSMRKNNIKTILIDAKPDNLHWMYSDRCVPLDIYNVNNVDKVVDLAKKHKCDYVLFQSDDNILPFYYKVNQLLGKSKEFTSKSLNCSLKKKEMRDALNQSFPLLESNFIIEGISDIESVSCDFPVLSKSKYWSGC